MQWSRRAIRRQGAGRAGRHMTITPGRPADPEADNRERCQGMRSSCCGIIDWLSAIRTRGMNPLIRAIIVALVALPLLVPAAEAARTYKWVDEDGVTHYTQYPPPDKEAQVIEPDIGIPSDTGTGAGGDSGDDSGQQSADASGDQDGSGPKTMDEYCSQMREQLKLLNSGKPVRIKNEDGSLTSLEGDARAAKRADIATKINQNCGN
ncbi:MAG: DUF4124 domain-containing protein [Halofilum sp. (in: g-proteobacteria)]|nr:DUF4124 domain-containing protein [Halofilum sp. (in: g-proteobacteria)]